MLMQIGQNVEVQANAQRKKSPSKSKMNM